VSAGCAFATASVHVRHDGVFEVKTTLGIRFCQTDKPFNSVEHELMSTI
jgi:hypothetical protein